MAGEIAVRALQSGDRKAWELLWRGYLAFYETSLASDVIDATWRRFFDPLEALGALVAERDGRLIGIAHYLLHRSTWAPVCYCYLEDLFVEASARGSGAGRTLIAAVEAVALEAGASRLYWMTHETNQTAQNLYNRIAERPGFMQYRKML
jgi:GNAT superfamily N-acetyltransferase